MILKKITYQTKILIILMNKAMNNEKKLNCLQSLNEKYILPFEGSLISKLINDGSGLSIKQQNDCTSFTDQQTNTLI